MRKNSLKIPPFLTEEKKFEETEEGFLIRRDRCALDVFVQSRRQMTEYRNKMDL